MLKLFYFLICCSLTQIAFSQNCDGFENFPEGVERAKELHVTCVSLIENEEYEAAFPIWQRLMKYSAAGHVYHFINGITIYEYFLERDAEDEEKAKEHKEQIVNLYEWRLKCLSPERGDSGIVMEAFAYQLSSMDYEDTDKTLEIFEKAVELNGNKTSAYILAYYADFAVFLFGNDALSKAEMMEIYYKLKEIKDANINDKQYLENWKYVEEYFQDASPVRTFDCEFYIVKFKQMYDEKPNDVEQLKMIIKKLEQLECQETDLYRLLKSKTTD